MADDAKTKHLSLHELLQDEDFKTLGDHEENEYSAELDKQIVKDAAKVLEEFDKKLHSNDYIL